MISFEMVEEKFVRGGKISSITTINKFKGIMNDLVRGYPAYLNWGIFETYFGESTPAIIKFLEEDGIIKTFPPEKKGGPIRYRVTAQGIIFSTAMAQLEYSQRMNAFTKLIILLGGGTLLITLIHLLVALFS